ncbi:MAG: helix-turn-helix domain-containing protein [Clostridia bacterium]
MNESMGAIIARKRKELGLTQEQLATALGISYQAVSKWENELSSPDISALPLLADTLGLTLDELFGRETLQALVPVPAPGPKTDAAPSEGAELPWPDDDTLYAVLFVGHRLVGHEGLGSQQVILHIEGDAKNVQSDFDVKVDGEVQGSVSAGGDVDCGAVGGDVNAGGDVDCGDVQGHVNAVGDVDCSVVEGNVSAGGDASCDGVEGGVQAGGDVSCGNVGGSVQAGGDLSCGTVGGNARAEGDLSCGFVAGRASSGAEDEEDFHSNLKGKKHGFSFELKL